MSKIFISVLVTVIRTLPDAFICQIQDIGLAELDRRGLIVWTDTTENKAFKE